jgi:hypothetical protein
MAISICVGMTRGWEATADRRRVITHALARQIVEVADRQDDTTYRLVGYRLLDRQQR